MPLTKYDGSNFMLDVALRILLFSLYAIFEVTPPFRRIIQPEEIWMYKHPVTESFCPMNVLWELVLVIPSAAIFINYMMHRDKTDVIQAFLSFSLIISLNGALTNLFKVIVGRPRPDFYFRCFPNGIGNNEFKDCTGHIGLINDGLKSFPSGHSSVAFASLGFLSLYLAGKMHLFSPRGKGSTWRLLSFLTPLVVASAIAISRTCDYHHHWQGFHNHMFGNRDGVANYFPAAAIQLWNVVGGSLLGFGICWLCYHNYYPSLTADRCHIPWVSLNSKHPTDHLKVNDI